MIGGDRGWRRLAARFWWFGVIGVLATVVHVSVGLTLHHAAGAAPLWANTAAFSAAVLASFVGHTRRTFPEAEADGAAFVRFALAALFGFGINQLIVWVVTGPLGEPYWIALVCVLAVVPAMTYLLLRYWALRI